MESIDGGGGKILWSFTNYTDVRKIEAKYVTKNE